MMNIYRQILCNFALVFCIAAFAAADDLIAIDVLIQPDQKMLSASEKWNAKMREQTPGGFELDEEHAPHII